jgi:hypothetical protein
MNTIIDFFANKILGQLIARAAVTAAAYAAGPVAQAALGKAGLSVSVDPNQLAAGVQAVAHMAYSWLKAKFAPATTPATPAASTPPAA